MTGGLPLRAAGSPQPCWLSGPLQGDVGTAERRVLPSVSGVLTPRHLWSTCVTRRNPRAGVCRGSKGLSGLKEHGC